MPESALVIGCGSIGSRHAQNLASAGVDIYAYDTDEARRNELATAVNGTSTSSISDGVAVADLVFVCTPSDYHIPPAQQAADAGCDIFIEKPLSNNEVGVSALIETVARKDLITMVGCNFRFHPAMKCVRELLENGQIGNVVSARIETGSYLPDWHPWEDYREMYSAQEGVGGVLLDAIHGINYGRWFFGDESEVTAMLGFESSLEIETEDTASLITRYANDVQCEYHFDYVQRTPLRSGHITGEEGSIRWGDIEETVHRYDVDADEWLLEQDYSQWDIDQMYIDMLGHFLDSIRNRRKTTSPIETGWKDLQLVQAAKKSSREGIHVTL